MTTYLHGDFETRSELELGGNQSVGLHNYATHSSTRAPIFAWGYGDEPVELWKIYSDPMPDKLRKGIEDPKQLLAAWNSPFERNIFQHVLKIVLPIERWRDPQASARYLSLPADLDTCGKVLGLPYDLLKDERGEELIKIFTKPTQHKKKRGEAPTYYFRDHLTDPELWEQFCEYCRQDVRAEREIMRRLTLLQVFPLPEREQKIWVFDQRVNDRGIPVNVPFVEKAYSLANREKQESIQKQNELTGLENANSPVQLLAWARKEGYQPNSLRKEAVAADLKYNEKLTPLGREVLEARKAASSTTYKKLSAILRQVSTDNRLRNQFVYMGSSRCGRWTGNAVQFHNMARPEERFEDLDNMDWLRAMIFAEDYDAIKLWFPIEKDGVRHPGSVLLCVKSAIRTAFETSGFMRFNVCDLSAIETRVSAWVSGCAALLKVFTTYFCLDHPEHVQPNKGKCPCGKKLIAMDPYLDFAVKMTGIPYIKLARDLKSKDPAVKAAAKRIRQMAKPAVLGCCYRLGGGQMGVDKNGDPVKQGLWGYAEGYGVEMTREQAHELVRVYRESYKEICETWYALEKAIADVLDPETTQVKREVGPNGSIKIDKINIVGRDPILRIQLPSGRYLHYIDASIQEVKMPWEDREGNEVYKATLCYSGIDQVTKQWKRGITSHGGKVFENIVQGIARDILAESLLKFEFVLDLPIVLHVHDEGGAETQNDLFAPGLEVMEQTMSEPVDWAPGLPLGAEGFEARYYHK